MTTDDDQAPIVNDPDLDHLLNLISMLPGPKENPRFWASVQAEGHPGDGTGRPEINYVFKKMAWVRFLISERTPEAVRRVTEALLFFFSAPQPELWEVLNVVTPNESSWGRDDSGRWWAEDITRTSWKLYVRYHQFGDDRWKEKWSFERNWHEWLPDHPLD